MKKVTQNGTVASHERYLYRGYLQIAALDMLDNRNVLRTLLWDPLEPVATRPLALAQDASLYCYSMDFNKNVTEVFDAQGTIAAAYDYSPYGAVTGTGSLGQPVQWSGEMHDEELALVYYNYRYYNPADGRWISRDLLEEKSRINLYEYGSPLIIVDYNGLLSIFGYNISLGTSFSAQGCMPIPVVPGLYACVGGSLILKSGKCCDGDRLKSTLESELNLNVSVEFGWGISPLSISFLPMAEIPFTSSVPCPHNADMTVDGYVEFFGTIPGAEVSARYSISSGTWSGGISSSWSISVSVGVRGGFYGAGVSVSSDY